MNLFLFSIYRHDTWITVVFYIILCLYLLAVAFVFHCTTRTSDNPEPDPKEDLFWMPLSIFILAFPIFIYWKYMWWMGCCYTLSMVFFFLVFTTFTTKFSPIFALTTQNKKCLKWSIPGLCIEFAVALYPLWFSCLGYTDIYYYEGGLFVYGEMCFVCLLISLKFIQHLSLICTSEEKYKDVILERLQKQKESEAIVKYELEEFFSRRSYNKNLSSVVPKETQVYTKKKSISNNSTSIFPTDDLYADESYAYKSKKLVDKIERESWLDELDRSSSDDPWDSDNDGDY